MKPIFTISAASVLMLAGCAHITPSLTTTELPTAQSFDADYRPDGTIVASELSYQDYFNDPKLHALIESALNNNRDLLAATARVEQARAQFRIQDSRRLPTVGADGSAVRARTPSVDSNNNPVAVTFNSFDVGVGIASYELDFWGRVKNLTEVARSQYLATVSAQRAFYLSLVGDVASTYFDLIETEEQITLAAETIATREKSLKLARLRLDAGVTSALDFHQAEALLTQAQQALSTQQLSAATIRNQLTVLIGGRLPKSLPEGLSLGEQTFIAGLDAGLPSDLLLVRPDIIAAEQSLKAANANIAVARAAFFPTISLTGRTGLSSSDLGDLFSSDSLTWRFGPSIDLPIFDWGAREADLGLAKAQEMESVANYDKVVQTAFREVSDALAGRRWLAELVHARTRTVTVQQRIGFLAQRRYDEGTASYLEVLDAERNLFIARQSLLDARRMEDQNAVSLFIALGGGLNGSKNPL
ncbi:outer membrane protein OprM [Algimonas arctica]|uniref:Outer membrane protein OprM n=1 Tax=Algimonas arctica TaxID=1479486 RepID=A0A8J3CU26_9PROT|nr:efflux transporter outer membrane subunit [Algimonas arctica]GHB02056.1 outer membrane protein OprM [Algimonas arctica]